MAASGVDPTSRLEPLRTFLSDARSKKLIPVALASYVKIKRKSAAERQSLGTAHLLTAQLHLRVGNYRQGLAALLRSFRLKPRGLLSPRTFRVLFNALFNRLGHRALWTLRGIARLTAGGEKP